MTIIGFCGRFKVVTRIAAAFTLLLVLLGLIGGSGLLTLSTTERRFDDYAVISNNALRIERISASIFDMRRNVITYIHTGNPQASAQARRIQTDLADTVAEAIREARDPARRANLERMRTLIDGYRANYERLVPLRERRGQLVDQGMNPIGQKAREDLSEIVRTAMADGDMEAAALAGIAQEALMLARLEANRFLAAPGEETADRFRDRVAQFEQGVGTLLARLRNPERQREAKEALDLAKRYQASFDEVRTAVFEVDRLVNGVMSQEAGEFTDLASRTVDQQSEARAALLAETERDMDRTMQVSIVFLVAATVIGVLAAWIVGRSIVQPVTAMTRAMERLAAGDLTVAIPAQGHRDEIGDMAAAVQVFKDNATSGPGWRPNRRPSGPPRRSAPRRWRR
ncbi:HAMP domain-containing protein [Azospirillum thermophilum]|nr:HAMP domain-containing protein [Azospirillum thermophilum]